MSENDRLDKFCNFINSLSEEESERFFNYNKSSTFKGTGQYRMLERIIDNREMPPKEKEELKSICFWGIMNNIKIQENRKDAGDYQPQ